MLDKASFIKRLLPRHNKILDLCLEGYSLKAIASMVDPPITVTQLRNIRNSPSFQHEYAIRLKNQNDMHDELIVRDEQNAGQILKDSSDTAARKVVELINSPDDAIAFRSAADVLDRTGYPKVAASINQNATVVAVLDSKDVERLASTLELDKD